MEKLTYLSLTALYMVAYHVAQQLLVAAYLGNPFAVLALARITGVVR